MGSVQLDRGSTREDGETSQQDRCDWRHGDGIRVSKAMDPTASSLYESGAALFKHGDGKYLGTWGPGAASPQSGVDWRPAPAANNLEGDYRENAEMILTRHPGTGSRLRNDGCSLA